MSEKVQQELSEKLLPDNVTVSIDPATAQTLMDWNVLHATEGGWTIDLDVWRTKSASLASQSGETP